MHNDASSGSGIADLSEKGRSPGGEPIRLDRRLYMQLLAFGDCADAGLLAEALSESSLEGVLYEDMADPRGVGLLTYHEDPSFFSTTLRGILNNPPFKELTLKHDLVMTGRTYSLGHETDLEYTLIRRPIERVLNPDWPWAVWYPLRRSGSFEQLDAKEQRDILMEHARLGVAFSEAGHGHDIRLACHGIDRNDNDFVIGLLGPGLHPLSAMVQAMRKTTQTSRHLDRIGPFFVGRVRMRIGR